MRHVSKVVNRVVIVTLLACVVSGCTPSPEERALQKVVRQVIQPGYIQFSDKSAGFARMAASYCGKPLTENLQHPLINNDQEITFDELRQGWRDSWQAWQHIQVIRFGPVMENNLHTILQSWPDKKNLIQQKVEGLIASQDVLSLKRIKEAGGFLQGFGAQEYLLFDAMSDLSDVASASRRCELLLLSSASTATISADIADAWRAYGSRMVSAGEKNSLYPTQAEAIKDVLDSIVASTEFLKRNKLGYENSVTGKHATEQWRSDRALLSVRAGLAGIQRLYASLAGLIEGKDVSTHQRVLNAMNDARTALVTIELPLEQRVNERQQALLTLDSSLQSLLVLFQRDVPQLLGITLDVSGHDDDGN